jgi:hypothetical protein
MVVELVFLFNPLEVKEELLAQGTFLSPLEDWVERVATLET